MATQPKRRVMFVTLSDGHFLTSINNSYEPFRFPVISESPRITPSHVAAGTLVSGLLGHLHSDLLSFLDWRETAHWPGCEAVNEEMYRHQRHACGHLPDEAAAWALGDQAQSHCLEVGLLARLLPSEPPRQSPSSVGTWSFQRSVIVLACRLRAVDRCNRRRTIVSAAKAPTMHLIGLLPPANNPVHIYSFCETGQRGPRLALSKLTSVWDRNAAGSPSASKTSEPISQLL